MNDHARKPSNLNKGLAYAGLGNAAESTSATPAPSSASPASTPAPAPVVKKPQRKQVTYYHEGDALKRAKQAHLFTQGHTGHKGWTDFVETAVDKYTKQLEAEYNQSRPFGS